MDTYQTAPQAAPQTYDYEDYDRIWQRVLPELNTFPESRNEDGDLPGTPIPGDDELMELPGAQRNPCCLGTAAQNSINVIIGFLEVEMANCRFYRCFYPKAPNPAAARAIRQMMLDEMDHVRRLRRVVCAFMIEKKEALDNIEETVQTMLGVGVVQLIMGVEADAVPAAFTKINNQFIGIQELPSGHFTVQWP